MLYYKVTLSRQLTSDDFWITTSVWLSAQATMFFVGFSAVSVAQQLAETVVMY